MPSEAGASLGDDRGRFERRWSVYSGDEWAQVFLERNCDLYLSPHQMSQLMALVPVREADGQFLLVAKYTSYFQEDSSILYRLRKILPTFTDITLL